MLLELESIRQIKAALLGLLLLVVLWPALRNGNPRLQHLAETKIWKVATAAMMGLLFVAASLSLFDFGRFPKFGTYENTHDIFHYYLGSKYSYELGYYQLYPCVLLADAENHDSVPQHPRMRRLDTYRFVDAAWITKKEHRFCKRFTTARWDEFKEDVEHFHARFANGREKRWRRILEDKGYNATPTWNAVAKTVSGTVPVEQIGILAIFDLVLMAAATAALGWTFGWRTGTLFWILFCLSYPMSYTHIRGGFLRLDWLACLVGAMACVRRDKFAFAGGLLAYAVCARVFPVAFLCGPFACAVFAAMRLRDSWKKHLHLWTTLVIVGVALVGASFLQEGALLLYKQYFDKIMLHDNGLSPMRVGLKYALLGSFFGVRGSWSEFATQAAEFLSTWGFLWWTTRLGLVALLAWIARKMPVHEALSIGYAAFAVFFAPTFYYHVCLIIPAVLGFENHTKRPWLVASAACIAGNLAMHLVGLRHHVEERVSSFAFSWIALGICAVIVWAAHYTTTSPDAITKPARATCQTRPLG